jgi:diacylglycerol kinase family enzyme
LRAPARRSALPTLLDLCETRCPRELLLSSTPGRVRARQEKLADNLAQQFQSAGLIAEIIFPGNGPEIVEAARRAAQQEPLAIVAGGGDGTINAVASALVDTRIPLGVLPLGTLNHFAKDLHIPLELEEATRNIMAGHVVNIDIGEVNDRIILNNSSLGLYPSIVRLRD